MSRPTPIETFRSGLKSDSFYSDEIINIILLRPLAAIVVWLVYPTRITPNHVTVAAIIVGFLAAAIYAFGPESSVAAAGILALAKDILDDADGQLARTKKQYSRRGRFLDSIGDFAVDAAIFSAISFSLYSSSGSVSVILLGLLSFLGTTLRVSYHVFYQASFLHLEKRYALNRITEEVTREDEKGDPVALKLQRLFNAIYLWQDTMMGSIDRWCANSLKEEGGGSRWYADKPSLILSGLLGFGTEFTILFFFSIFDSLESYLLFNVVVMNAVWLANILYRKVYLARAIRGL